MITSIRGNVFEDPLAQENPTSSMNRNVRTGKCLEKKLTSHSMTTIPIPCFQRRARCKSHESANCHFLMTGNDASGTYSQYGMMNYAGYQIPVGKFPVSTLFQSWKVNFRTEVCSKAKDPRLAMQRIKEIEIAKSVDDLITTRSTLGRSDFPDYDELDAMMTAALRKLFDRQTHFRKKVSFKEQRAQSNDRFLTGRLIAFMIFDHLRSTGPEDRNQGLSDLFSIRWDNDDTQDFDPRCEQEL